MVGVIRTVEDTARCSECSPFTHMDPAVEVELPPDFVGDLEPSDDSDGSTQSTTGHY